MIVHCNYYEIVFDISCIMKYTASFDLKLTLKADCSDQFDWFKDDEDTGDADGADDDYDRKMFD